MNMAPFSPRQMQALTWWCQKSRFSSLDAVIWRWELCAVGKRCAVWVSFFSWALLVLRAVLCPLWKTIRSLRRNLVLPVLPILQELGFTC